MTRAVLLVTLIIALCGCGPKVKHPAPSETLQADGEVVGSVNGRPITAEEIRLVSERTGVDDPAKLREMIVERELLVDIALERGNTRAARHARKRAMVRALLEARIESRVTVDDVDPRLVQDFIPAVASEMRGVAGEHAAAIFIGPSTGDTKQAKSLAQKTKEEAEKAHAWLAEDPGLERMHAFDATTVEAPIGAKLNRSLRVLNPGTPETQKPEGWVRNNSLFRTLKKMEVGELSDPINVGAGYAILLRREPIEPDSDVTDEEVEAEARKRARDSARAAEVKQLVYQLEQNADIRKYPHLIEEQQQRKSP